MNPSLSCWQSMSLSLQCPQTSHPLLPPQPLLQQRQQLLLLVQQLQPLPEPQPELLQLPNKPEPELEQQQQRGQEPQPQFGLQEQPQQEQELRLRTQLRQPSSLGSATDDHLQIPGVLCFPPTYLAIDSNHPRY